MSILIESHFIMTPALCGLEIGGVVAPVPRSRRLEVEPFRKMGVELRYQTRLETVWGSESFIVCSSASVYMLYVALEMVKHIVYVTLTRCPCSHTLSRTSRIATIWKGLRD